MQAAQGQSAFATAGLPPTSNVSGMASGGSSAETVHVGTNVHQSADGKPLCTYSKKLCKQRRMDGWGFCVKHILEDKTAPFHRCAAICSNSKQCTNPVPNSNKGKLDAKYCSSHVAKYDPNQKKKKKKKKSKPKSKVQQRFRDAMKENNIELASPLRRHYDSSVAKEAKVEKRMEEIPELRTDTRPSLLCDKKLWRSTGEEGHKFASGATDPSLLSVEEQLQKRRSTIIRLANGYESQIHRVKQRLCDARVRFAEDLGKLDTITSGAFFESAKTLPAATAEVSGDSGQPRKRRRREGAKEGDVLCLKDGCRGKVVPLTTYCFAHVLEDKSQVLYKGCEYLNSSGSKCNYPVLVSSSPPICCGHVDLVAKRKRKKKEAENEEAARALAAKNSGGVPITGPTTTPVTLIHPQREFAPIISPYTTSFTIPAGVASTGPLHMHPHLRQLQAGGVLGLSPPQNRNLQGPVYAQRPWSVPEQTGKACRTAGTAVSNMPAVTRSVLASPPVAPFPLPKQHAKPAIPGKKPNPGVPYAARQNETL